MRPSIIQLKHLFFRQIEIARTEPDDQGTIASAVDFDFENVQFRVALKGGDATLQREDGLVLNVYSVTLGIGIDQTPEKPVPYRINLEAVAFLTVDAQAVSEDDRGKLAIVNGASMIYGAMRELVTTLTGRFMPGGFILPTMDFRDQVMAQRNSAKENEGEKSVE